MIEKRKYAAYDPETQEFKGFYTEDRKDLPSTVSEVNPSTFLEDKGQHTHYNPETSEFYTPTDVAEAMEITSRRDWRNGELFRTDRYMIRDWPISENEKQTLIRYRQALRDYPETWIKPQLDDFV